MDAAATLPPSPRQPAAALPSLSLGQAARVWARIGLLSFGGPAAQIALMHREIVAARGWVGERRFLHALSFCALLPGPEAQQLATYLGWLMHGVPGGILAGGLFVLPGAAVLLGLSILYATLGQAPAVGGLFLGLQCAVLPILLQAVLLLSSRTLRSWPARWLACGAFVALAVFGMPFPAIVATAALAGVCLPRRFGSEAHVPGQAMPSAAGAALAADPASLRARGRNARRAGAAALVLWLAPVAALAACRPGRFADIALFFSRMALVTFGGAYAVLAYVVQDAVHAKHWLSAGEMLSGMGMAETTPGPLILVLQFVGFMAGARAPGALTGLWGGVAGAALTLWVTFVPCFAYVFLGAPAMERIAGSRKADSALAAVSAGVVGIIASLGVWFAGHVLFGPDLARLHADAAAITLLGAVLLFGLHQSPQRMLALCALAGMGLR